MVNVRYMRGLVKMMDSYGPMGDINVSKVDVIISTEVLFPPTKQELPTPEKGVLQSIGKTLIIDLQRSEEEIYADIGKNARYKINRASKRDPITYHELTAPTDEEIEKFVAFFDGFSKHKKIQKANVGRLKGLRDQDSLLISYVMDEDSHVLCYHAYLKTDTYCSLLHSASARFENSTMRNMIGRANRFLHWQDMKSLKKMGHKWFDFGGLFIDASAADEKNINQFKEEFGGRTVDVDKRFSSYSIIGHLVVFLFWFKMRKKPEFLRAKVI
ncbi:hypothetical protein SAMN05216389_10387 [Oceanobacillus limi]|uniref:Acetyltransferase (GNAT) domain-containing protein n=1 Tax=Oceanobacillus limi TaxID=930131 RepID=A0A1I0A5H7_9BACI|nr:hypothetical protein [Oceanobacillus limi]SES89422.1 hypothetical protein SAMN05216389_10387 [Oceanobacillus limi]